MKTLSAVNKSFMYKALRDMLTTRLIDEDRYNLLFEIAGWRKDNFETYIDEVVAEITPLFFVEVLAQAVYDDLLSKAKNWNMDIDK